MFTQASSLKSLIVVATIAMLSAACAPANNFTEAKSVGSSSTSVVDNTVVSSCSTQIGSGYVYNENLDGQVYSSKSFKERVGDLVSATLDPQEIGEISGTKDGSGTYVRIEAYLKFDSSGNVITNSSTLNLSVYDSYVGQVIDGQTVMAYPINFSTATSGQVNKAQKTFTITFQDNYGSITLSGTYTTSGSVSGKLSFANSKAFDGSAPRSGVLGAIKLNNCALSL